MKKKTGGGMFDPSEEVIYFAAGNMFSERSGVAIPRYSLIATNDLMNNKSGQRDLFNRLDDPENRLLLDSGIFWLTNKHKREHPPMTMDEALSLPPGAIDGFDLLWETYTKLVTQFEDRLWGYIELDQGGAENKKKTRAKLEGIGLRPIPVYHPLNDGWDYFDELCQGYDRICVGNVVQANYADRRALLHMIWERHRRYPDVWIHLLGVTPDAMCTVYPANSTDSATFAYSLKFGANTTPFSTGMNGRIGRLDRSFSYLTDTDNEVPGAVEDGVRFLVAHASFMQQSWRTQQRDLEAVLGHPPLPPVHPKEAKL